MTTPDSPMPVREVSAKLGGWIGRLGAIWTEGEVVAPKISGNFCYFALRDLQAKVTLNAMAPRTVWESLAAPATDGSRVVVHGRPDWYAARGTLSLKVDAIKPVGDGELLAQLERRKQLLAAEGLFDPVLKRPLPFLPTAIGLITGRESAAERDVLENARARWPGVVFEISYALMQGERSASDVMARLDALEKSGQVDVIVIARGGGSLEDLLPFSDEALIRRVAACRIPVVSAIGHEPDTPLLDYVADLRASTPTDAAKRIVPDVAEEVAALATMRRRTILAVQRFLDHENSGLAHLRSRPALSRPQAMIDAQHDLVAVALERARRSLGHRLDRDADAVAHHLARVQSLSPLATLRRGYAVAQRTDGHIIAGVADAPEEFTVRLADGRIHVATRSIEESHA